jgi:hypothetical protein
MSFSRNTKSDQMTMPERRKLAEALVKFSTSIGGRLVRKIDWQDGCGTQYEFDLETPLGILRVSFTTIDVHLHCRFEAVERAKTVMCDLINPYTGKYNAYAFGRFTAVKAMQQMFVPHLQIVWHRCGQTAPWKQTVEAV